MAEEAAASATPPYHPVVQQILDVLTTNDCWHQTFEHDAVLTSEAAAATRPGYGLHQGAKAIVVRYKVKGAATPRHAMLVLPADAKFDNRAARKALGTKDIRFAPEDEVATLTGNVLPGGVPPFGNLFQLDVLVDRKLLDNERIVFNAGDRRFSVAMLLQDYLRLVDPTVCDFTVDPAA
ncbi:uncharacterized protein MONBRDRAFT_12776 [Monosiga brevicollis MX1]|uniref:YbaK/aminoacyl-tRNA synthetase-associated domain-containing protein n=1 Tax=Monosiga brevicollis TaxID=81824 RepID=A9VDA2_MONBE|nr:uncharacterized protein MONBRDRAFT_12776 [Monosiga brevicollis MX1]EDQ84493.1 predicted protein [Monosiga brevicollis MX1]|eukprot:XP_001750680.1 hypothetical protein [Monosiga brevicollis MX1]